MNPEDACLHARDEEIQIATEHIEHARRWESMRLAILICKGLVRS